MQGERLLARLIDKDVIDDSGEIPVFSETFLDRVASYEAELALRDDGAELETYVRDELDDVQIPNYHSEFDADDAPYLAELLALNDLLTDAETALQVLPTLDLFGDSPPPVEGTPELFVQVSGPRLRTLAKLYERCIIYAWGYDCPPCETVRGDFDELLDEPMEGIPLFAVCGEDCYKMLYDEFNMRGAPTVVFILEGKNDLRLEGPSAKEVLERELEKFPTVRPPHISSGPDSDADNDASEETPDTAD